MSDGNAIREAILALRSASEVDLEQLTDGELGELRDGAAFVSAMAQGEIEDRAENAK